MMPLPAGVTEDMISQTEKKRKLDDNASIQSSVNVVEQQVGEVAKKPPKPPGPPPPSAFKKTTA
jgi:hypothetical protein